MKTKRFCRWPRGASQKQDAHDADMLGIVIASAR